MRDRAGVPDRGVLLQRERVIRRLVTACGAGRLPLKEALTRAEEAQRAVTYEELSTLTADLPGPEDGAVSADSRGARRLLVAFLTVHGCWPFQVLGRKVLAAALLGEAVIDLRHTPVTSFSTRISAVAVAGEVRIIVPASFRVETVRKTTVLGYVREPDAGGAQGPLMPVLRVSATAILGDVRVERR